MRHIIIEPLSKGGKTLIARRGVGGNYCVVAECRLRDVAASIAKALNKEDEK